MSPRHKKAGKGEYAMSVHCVIDKEKFLDILAGVQNVTNKKNTMAILSNILLRLEESKLKITATDTEVCLQFSMDAEEMSAGSITLPSKKLYEIVKVSGSSTIEIKEMDNNWVTIKAGPSTYNLAGMASVEYPEFPRYESEKGIKSPSVVFLELIDKTQYSIAGEQENIYSLTSALMDIEERDDEALIRMVSSDGHRLSVMEKITGNEILKLKNDDGLILIPKRGIQEMKKYCESRDEIEIYLDGGQFFIGDGKSTLVIRLKGGEYPPYKSIIQSIEKKYQVTVEREKFIESLIRSDLFTRDAYHTIRIDLSKDCITLSSENIELGSSKEELPVSYEGEDLSLGFNCRYFIETLEVMEGEKVHMHLDGKDSACCFTSEADQGFLSIIMPMNI
ncbi:MAG: DNA polymerase III subunit beta [Desulfobulbaceae bacterium]|jgi:DNA polymerase-3 subunit beta|nr:DNA polymerase III subunit beta [Desulfobulbaceae bacterium]